MGTINILLSPERLQGVSMGLEENFEPRFRRYAREL